MKKTISLIQLKFKLAAILLVSIFTIISPDVSGQNPEPIKNIVIVHGAFADGSGWEEVYNILTKKGYRVTIVQNPLSSLEDDVRVTNYAIDRQDGPVLLVGHSYAGVVITQAGGNDKVKRLVYIAAYIPEVGESGLDVGKSGPDLSNDGIMPPDKNGILYYSKDKFHNGFAAELPKAKADFLCDAQGAFSVKALTTPVTYAAWKTKPSYSVIATDDKTINPVITRRVSKRAGAITTELPGCHAVFMSQPVKIAAFIETAANGGKY
ncbi:MAG: alpha/beta hydrolase [Chitinophagaceae bacterium]